ncbi:hypothetical protein Pint_15278 [Pistacia integerrima]|uniref:Uncharacterized protein n=1 Tax=Pistacia integerrima TaxID=434235 RepID=A0ACC0ZAX9_9ROSI|nr:hypothetical protein Pint_15278 [Pistacia integerrima]
MKKKEEKGYWDSKETRSVTVSKGRERRQNFQALTKRGGGLSLVSDGKQQETGKKNAQKSILCG